MITPAIYRVIAVLTDNWHAASPASWQLTFDAVDARGARLADVIRDRYLTLRDEVARQAFDQRRGVWDVAWQRAQKMAAARTAQGGNQLSHESHTTQPAKIIERRIGLDVDGGSWSPS